MVSDWLRSSPALSADALVAERILSELQVLKTLLRRDDGGEVGARRRAQPIVGELEVEERDAGAALEVAQRHREHGHAVVAGHHRAQAE